MSSPTKAILFDFYGVLVLNGWQDFKTKHFADREDVWDAVYRLSEQVDLGQAKYHDLVQFTVDQTGETEAAVRYQLEHNTLNTELLQYITTVLKPHYKIGILSNGGSHKVLDTFTLEQLELFNSVIFSRQAGFVKPQRDVYHLAASKFGLETSECLLVDDQERHIIGAHHAGMEGVVYTNVTDLKEELAKLL